MRAAHTIAYFAHAIEVRPNCHPESTSQYMTGTLSDGTVVDAAIVDAALGRDIGPYTDRESSMERLITRRSTTPRGRQGKSQGSPTQLH